MLVVPSRADYTNFDIIIIDNGSPDGSVEFIRQNYPNVKLVELKSNMGYSVGLNIGIEQSKSKYVIALNNDTTLDPNWLKELVNASESDVHIGSCQPKILSQNNPEIIDSVGLAINKNGDVLQVGAQEQDKGQYNRPKELLGACSASIMYRRNAILHIGCFDPDFFAYFEDVDVALRLNRAGWKCLYVPKAIVYHHGSATSIENSFFKTYLLERNQYYYKIKNQSGDFIFRFIIRRPGVMTQKFIEYIIKKRYRLILATLKGNIDGFRAFRIIYHKRTTNL